MSLSLDDLAQASYAATAKFLRCDHSHWDWASDTGKNQSRAEALAAVERFAEHLSHTECGLCESGDPPAPDDGGAFWHSRGRACTATYIHRLLSSLRAEVNTNTIAAKQQKGS